MRAHKILPLSILLLLTAPAIHAQQSAPSWIESATTPPRNLPASIKPIPLDALTSSTTPINASQWSSVRHRIKADWQKILGPLPSPPSGKTTWQVIQDQSLTTCSRQIIQYEAETSRTVRACILRPPGDTTIVRPGIVAFHPTTTATFTALSGTGGRPEQHLALQLVEKGFIVICPENFIYEQSTWLNSVKAARKRNPRSTGMATMLADGIRATDILLHQPGIDSRHIGTIGHSLGAKESLYLMAFDDRIQAGVSSEGGIGISFSNYHDPWYLGPQIPPPSFQHDHHELLTLIAPRPFLVFGGETGRAADGDRTWPYIVYGNQINQRLGKPARFALINHRQGHQFVPPYTSMAVDWLTCFLSPPAR